MRISPNPFMKSLLCTETIPMCDTCEHEYTVNTNMTLTTTLKNGYAAVSYLRYPTDDEGYLMIPDNESLKLSIFYFVLYMYHIKQDLRGDDKAAKKMMMYLDLYAVQKAKAAAELAEPDIAMLENIKDRMLRLVPKANEFNRFFQGLNNKTTEDTGFNSSPRFNTNGIR